MSVLISNRQNKTKISRQSLRKTAQAVLNASGCPESELSILILDDPQIAVLNKEYLNREGPTNVIAFPMHEGEFPNLNPELLGDVVISVETAQKEGEATGISMEARFTELLVHGILHLLGYDHEKTEEEAIRMENKSSEILKRIAEEMAV
ncbi:MAG: rRNA maturation RNase YbeY [Desulfobacteraceae bacterium IS3]|nr:MAG: rRNA maturation RNase YbeY [Desulfobacteraceae bacterium IS3]